MKRLILLALLTVISLGAATAQNYIIVDSEKIFKSIAEYNTALKSLDVLAEQYQVQVDAKFKVVETMYDNYVAQRSSLSASTRQLRENEIIRTEKEATKFQEDIFNTDGTLMKKRLELISPIQKRVFEAIKIYATNFGVEMVLDSSSNAALLYNSPSIEHTERVISYINK